ncbi:hypothetical protein BJF78_17435 [Pseudonocardia sp. CNS-139]|nr:hypothetical protein BJF78_17435 [Pseudonocardia sp. CNS-139]
MTVRSRRLAAVATSVAPRRCRLCCSAGAAARNRARRRRASTRRRRRPPPPRRRVRRRAGGAGRDAGFNLQDVQFLQQMIPHHQQAIMLTTAALNRSPSAAVREFAEQERQRQVAEVQQMSDWLFSIGITPDLGAPGGAHAHGGGMTQKDVEDLATWPEPDFDARFTD